MIPVQIEFIRRIIDAESVSRAKHRMRSADRNLPDLGTNSDKFSIFENLSLGCASVNSRR